MDLLPLVVEHQSARKKVVFAGTDPGLVVTSVAVPRTLEAIFSDINRFQALADGSGEDDFDVERLPKSHKITASRINEVTFARQHRVKREKRRRQGINDQKKRAKESRERELRTKRAYGKIAAEERRHIWAHASTSKHSNIVHLFGDWRGINCGIKGHTRRGLKRIRAEHRAFSKVAMTNEFNTSKTCSYCFCRVVLHKARRVVDGKQQVVRLNGAVECVNPRCPAKKLKYTTRGRDAAAASNIALSGASIILSSDHTALPCFRRNSNNTRYSLATLPTAAAPELVPPGSIRDE